MQANPILNTRQLNRVHKNKILKKKKKGVGTEYKEQD